MTLPVVNFINKTRIILARGVLKLKLDVNLLEHLQQIERDPDSTFVELLMKLQQNTKSHEHLCMLNYLSHWKL